jgi:hypothetical protein
MTRLSMKQLQKQNVKLKAMQSKLNDMQRMQQERINLMRENRQLSFRLKHGKAVAITDRILNTTARSGIKAFGFIQKYGQRLAAAERKEKSVNRHLNAVAKRKRR